MVEHEYKYSSVSCKVVSENWSDYCVRRIIMNDQARSYRLHFHRCNPSHAVPKRTHSISNRRRHHLCYGRPFARPTSPLYADRAERFSGRRYPFAGFQSNFVAIANSRGLYPHAAMAFGTQKRCDCPSRYRHAQNSSDRLFGICQRRANTPI